MMQERVNGYCPKANWKLICKTRKNKLTSVRVDPEQ